MKSTHESFFVRDFQLSDYIELESLWIESSISRPERGDNLEMILRTLKSGAKLLVLVSTDNQQIIGSSWITNDGRRLYLHHFCISQTHRGKKLSHLLMLESMKFAKQLNMQIKLEVHSTNKIAIELYKRHEFEYLGNYHTYIMRDIEAYSFESFE